MFFCGCRTVVRVEHGNAPRKTESNLTVIFEIIGANESFPLGNGAPAPQHRNGTLPLTFYCFCYKVPQGRRPRTPTSFL